MSTSTAAAVASILTLSVVPGSAAFASPSVVSAPAPVLRLRLDSPTARRVLAASGDAPADGASQEADQEKPKAMDDQAAASAKASGPHKVAEPEDRFAFVKDWPFWVVVGGVIVAGAATYMLVRNANEVTPCGARYAGNCLGAR